MTRSMTNVLNRARHHEVSFINTRRGYFTLIHSHNPDFQTILPPLPITKPSFFLISHNHHKSQLISKIPSPTSQKPHFTYDELHVSDVTRSLFQTCLKKEPPDLIHSRIYHTNKNRSQEILRYKTTSNS